MVGSNPFPGLRPFEADESHLFFGREAATDELLRKLRNNRFIAVVGTSGSGKSSLVRAGVLPDLHGGFMAAAGSSWRVAILRPGDAPIQALAESLSAPGVLGREGQRADMQRAITETVLRRGAFGLVDVVRQARLGEGENLLVLVDQFEELFRIHPSRADRSASDESAAFVKLLLEAAKQSELPIYVMLTMRSEYLGDCTRFRDLPEAINAGQYLIPRMTRDQARTAITGPIAVAGASISPPLVQRLLNDVGDNPDQLPIMQHAMMRTWSFWEADHKDGEEIGLAHYQATGGMDEALSRHADEAYQELPDDATRAVAARVFKRLTGRGAGDREMRFPATVAELCALAGASRDKVLAVIDAFRREDRSLLMPPAGTPLSDETVIDISHESLIRIWKRLRQWVEEEGLSARIYTRLAETADLHKRNEAGLWRNPDLQIALNWRARNRPNEAWSHRYHAGFGEVMAFLDASKSAAFRRKVMILVPAVLIPLLGGAYVVTKAVYEKKAVQKELAVVSEQKVEYQIALENVTQEDESEQKIAEQVVAQADKLLELDRTKQDFEARELEIQDEIDRQLAALQDVESRGGDEVEKEGILGTLTVLSQSLKDFQAQGRRKKERIASEFAAGAEQLTELTSNEQSVADAQTTRRDSGTPGVGEPPGADETEMASLEALPVTYREDAGTGGSADAVPAQDDDMAESQEPVACVEARDSEGTSPVAELLQKWQACLAAAAEGQGRSVAEQEIAALEESLSRYASIASPEKFLTCKSVKKLECVGASGKFSRGKVYVFARVNAPESASLPLVWLRQDGSEIRSTMLKVKQNTGKGFRTFAYKTVVEPGSYAVKLYNERNMLIGIRQFAVR